MPRVKLPFLPKILISIALLIAFFVLLNLAGYSNPLRNFFYSISYPFQKISWGLGAKSYDFLTAVSNISKLKEENEQLKIDNQGLLQESIALQDLKKENEILRTALDSGLKKDFKIVVAAVIGKDISQDFILIDRGVRDGIKEGNPVVNQQKVLFGKVSEVFEKFSKVMLISNKKSSFDVKTQNENEAGIARGAGGSSINLDFISQETNISEGDTLLTSQLGGIYPENLLVGKIRKILKNDVEPLQKAEVEPFFHLKEAEILFIITDY